MKKRIAKLFRNWAEHLHPELKPVQRPEREIVIDYMARHLQQIRIRHEIIKSEALMSWPPEKRFEILKKLTTDAIKDNFIKLLKVEDAPDNPDRYLITGEIYVNVRLDNPNTET